MKDEIGGKLKGISLDAFLQMAQMEQITCTLSVASGAREGKLFLLEGTLISADTEGLPPLDAAHRIISWEKTVINISETCDKTVNEIKQPMMNILMEAMRLRDDAKTNPPPDPPEPKKAAPKSAAPPKSQNDSKNNTGAAGKKAASPKQKSAAAKKPKPEASPPQKRLPWKYIAIAGVVAIAIGGLTVHFMSSSKRTRLAYEALLQTVEITDEVDEKLTLLNSYVVENPDGKYMTDAKRVIEGLLDRKTARQFETVEEAAARLQAEGDTEGAIAVYTQYLKENEKSRLRNKASQAVATLSAQMETANFETMKQKAMGQGPERISTYLDFLEKHPGSNNREEILKLISDMEEEYFIFLQRRVLESEASGQWGKSVEIGQQFLSVYPTSDHTEEVTKMLGNSQDKYLASQSYSQLRSRADAFGTDYTAAKAVFEDYLKAYPGSPVKKKIKQEIKRLSELAEEKRLSGAASLMARMITESGARFTIDNNETFLDTRTGLMWCLLDSQEIENRCLTYDEATAHVSSLTTGGHDNWRLPTPEELSRLYKSPTPFPSVSGRWYWSSRTQKRYVEQWIIEVDVIQPDLGDEQEAFIMESWQCGSVRAVRRP